MSQIDPGSGFDEVALSELVEDMGGSMAEFVRGFLASLDETRAAMRVSLGAGRLAEVGDSAHRLKGTAGYLGAVELVQILAGIQRECGQGGEQSGLAALLDQVDRQAGTVRRRLLPLSGA